LLVVAGLTRVTVGAGEPFFSEGDEGGEMFLVEKGEVEASIDTIGVSSHAIHPMSCWIGHPLLVGSVKPRGMASRSSGSRAGWAIVCVWALLDRWMVIPFLE
jgi:hypothetical protein